VPHVHERTFSFGQGSAILQDREERYWFGTQFKGISVYEEPK